MSTAKPLISTYVVISFALTLALGGVSALATEVVMRTSMGDIRILLYDEDSPITAANFLQYVDEGFFDGDDGLGQTIFHRVIPGFVIQGGGHLADLTEKVTHDPIVNEASNGLSNLRGTLAMARTSDPNSATSQFFINHVNNPGLDYASPMNPGYAVFGRVIEGMDVVDAIAAVETETQGEYQDVPVVPIPVTDAERALAYVDVNATGPTHDGLSWCTAYTDLQEALAAAVASAGIISEIRVADGTYTPATCETPPCSFTPVSPEREATFQLINGVTLAGGYAGCNDGGDLRNIGLYETILGGDLNGDDGPDFANNDENSYHVVTGSGITDTDNTILDGFTVTAGNANGSPPHDSGAGMFNFQGSPLVTNCVFVQNIANADGGGMYNFRGSPLVTNCVFVQNIANLDGGGMYNDASSPTVRGCAFTRNSANSDCGGMDNQRGSSPWVINCTFTGNIAQEGLNPVGGAMRNMFNSESTVINCVFRGNTAELHGGAVFNFESDPSFVNCTFSSNSAHGDGGGVYNDTSSPKIENCVFWDNEDDADGGSGGPFMDESAQIHGGTPVVTYSAVEGCTAFCSDPADHNIADDPEFVDADGPDDIPGNEDDNLRLTSPTSPCIDAGNNEAVPPDVADLDEDGNTKEPTPLDLDYLARFVDDPLVIDTGNPSATHPNDIVDMGAYEYGCGNGTCGSFENQCNCPEDCGTPPTNEIAHGTCGDGIDNDCDGLTDCDDDGEDDCRYDTDCFGCAPVLAIGDPPHNARKNRYISFNPNNSDNECALQIRLASMRRCSGQLSRACTVDDDCEAAVPGSGTCVEHPDVGTAGPWWVQAHQDAPLGCLRYLCLDGTPCTRDGDCDGSPGSCDRRCGPSDQFARLEHTPYFSDWTDPRFELTTLHIGDCEIIPVATYEVRACRPPDGTECNLPLTIGTIAQPYISPGFRGNYGDVAGPVEGSTPDLYFTPPDGFTNVGDVSAYILTKQNYGTANKPQAHPTWIDLQGPGDGNPPQYILGVSDLQQILKAFAGDAWTDDPGNMNPQECP